MEILITFLILVAVFGLLGILYILIYNKYQNSIIRIKEAESDIDETLRKRFDQLVNLEKLIVNNTGLELDNFSEFTEDTKISNFDMDRKLTKAYDSFISIASDFEKELNIDEVKSLITELKINTEKLDAAKSYYNKHTTKLNLLVKKFPSNIIAKIHGIYERNYFDNKNLNDEDILDFKL